MGKRMGELTGGEDTVTRQDLYAKFASNRVGAIVYGASSENDGFDIVFPSQSYGEILDAAGEELEAVVQAGGKFYSWYIEGSFVSKFLTMMQVADQCGNGGDLDPNLRFAFIEIASVFFRIGTLHTVSL